MADWNFAYSAVFSGICLSGWGNSWQFRQRWHHGTSAARLLSCNRSRWWQMCAMTYQENSHSYIFFLDCNVKYKSEQECFGHVQGSALSWLDGQKQQNRTLRYIMDDILTVHASRSNNQNKKNPTSSLMRYALRGVTPLWDIFPCLLFHHFEKEHPHISTPETAALLDAAAE